MIVANSVEDIVILMKSKGYKVSAITCHDNLNAKKNCEQFFVIKKFSYKNVLYALKQITALNSKDIIFGSGVAEMVDSKKKFPKLIFLWNSPEILIKLNNPLNLFSKLSSLGVRIPMWSKVPPPNGNYLYKDIRSYGGLLISKFSNSLKIVKSKKKYFQKFVKGTNISVQFFSKSNKIKILSSCKQWNYERRKYLLGGIISVNLDNSLMKKLKKIINTIVLNFNLIGINSIDFIITNNEPLKIYLIDINPRPGLSSRILYRQTIGKSILNYSSQIIYSFDNKLMDKRSIEKLINIDPNIKFTEIPLPDTIIRKNQPICLAHKKVKDIGSLKKEYHNILEKINNI